MSGLLENDIVNERIYEGFLFWNTSTGHFLYSGSVDGTDESELYFVKDMKAVVIDGRLFCISGKPKNKAWKVKSNICKRGSSYETMYVYKEHTEAGRTVRTPIGSGSKWRGGLQEAVSGQAGKWTKVISVWMKNAVVKKAVRGHDGKLTGEGEWFTHSFERLAQIRLTGRSIMLGIGKGLEEKFGVKIENVSGHVMYLKGNFRFEDHENTMQIPDQASGGTKTVPGIYLYPNFESLRALNTNNEKEALFLKKLKEIFAKHMEWLKMHNEKAREHYMTLTGGGQQPIEAERPTPPPPVRNTPPAPVAQPEVNLEAGDDDLPF
jgi:hypothetical protein